MVSPVIRPIWVGDNWIGPGYPCFVIAEAGVNHNGSLEMALKLVDAAAEAGADAVKFQSFKAGNVVTRDAPKAEYQLRTTGDTESQFEMIRRLELNEEAHHRLVSHCRERGILFLSTPFDEDSADLLESLDVPAFKLPSGEITNLPFLRYVARKKRPIILSTGMSSLDEVRSAVEAIQTEGAAPPVLLQCVSNYPADPADVNLLAMTTMRNAFGVVVGYSDHTVGNEVALAAVALGASIVEKHFTLDRTLPGPDHMASAEPEEIAALVAGIRKVEKALGDGVKRPAESEANTARVARRSLVASCRIPAGTRIDGSMIVARRPGGGMLPDQAASLIGLCCRRDLEEGTLLNPGMFE
jgi:N-acetylneuraminate synthase